MGTMNPDQRDAFLAEIKATGHFADVLLTSVVFDAVRIEVLIQDEDLMILPGHSGGTDALIMTRLASSLTESMDKDSFLLVSKDSWPLVDEFYHPASGKHIFGIKIAMRAVK